MDSGPCYQVVHINEDEDKQCWIAHVKGQVDAHDSANERKLWERSSIYRMPAFAIELKKWAFTPQVVSFGPFHHGEGNLRAAEEHKQRALLHFLKRTARPLEDYVHAIKEDVDLLQDCYYRLDGEWKNKDRFTKLMIMDGCFMLEMLMSVSESGSEAMGYAINDPIFSAHGMLHKLAYIRRDMLRLENQLPLLVLKKLYILAKGSKANVESDINSMVLEFFGRDGKRALQRLGLHVLDVYRKSMLQPPSKTASRPDFTPHATKRALSAVRLREAGVRIRRSGSDDIWKVNFQESSGTLEVPHIVVDDATECIFLNLMAFEHLHDGAGSDITSYICFMDDLIDSGADVSLLQKKGIVENALGSDEAVAELFNNLTREMTLDANSQLWKTREKLRKYSKQKTHEWRASLKHTHFSNPWAMLSLFGAILLIVLAIFQTVYSGLTYQKETNPQPPPPPLGTRSGH